MCELVQTHKKWNNPKTSWCEEQQLQGSAALSPGVGPLWYVNSRLVSVHSDPEFPELIGENLATRGVWVTNKGAINPVDFHRQTR